MTRSLSVLLPVHNAEATLQADVGRMLDILPDLSHNFDVMIIDDGSTDETSEIAADLSARFPQVKLVRSNRRQGVEAALQSGLARTSAPTVVAHTGRPGIKESEVLQIWRDRDPSTGCGFRVLRRDAGEIRISASESAQNAGPDSANISKGDHATPRPAFLARVKSFAFGD